MVGKTVSQYTSLHYTSSYIYVYVCITEYGNPFGPWSQDAKTSKLLLYFKLYICICMYTGVWKSFWSLVARCEDFQTSKAQQQPKVEASKVEGAKSNTPRTQNQHL